MKKTLLILLLLASSAFGQAVGYVGAMENLVTYKYPDTTKKIDSAIFIVSYPTLAGGGNFYDTIKGLPHHADSLTCYADFFVDSVGVHGVIVIPYFNDGSHFTDYSGWTYDNRDTVVASSGSTASPGEDAVACTLIVLGDYDEEIQNAAVTVRTKTETTVKVPESYTDVNGRLIFYQDPDTYSISFTAQNYYPLVETLYIDSTGVTDTIELTGFSNAFPEPGRCRVMGRVITGSGVSYPGVAVSATLTGDSSVFKDENGSVITETIISTLTDSLGIWYLDLIPNKLINDTLSQWVIQISTLQIYKPVTVPISLNWNFR